MNNRIVFPWPPKELSPNARVHWAKKAKAVRSYKADCLYLCLQNQSSLIGRSKFKLVFHPPSHRRNDADNQIASFKPGFDAMSQIAGVDDSQFEWTYVRGEPVKGGCVIVEVLK